MKAQISAGLNFAMSGIPYWTMDIGGFSVENRYMAVKEGSEDLREWRELNTVGISSELSVRCSVATGNILAARSIISLRKDRLRTNR